MAESVGFEPTEPCGSSDFKSGAFDHSANSPFNTAIVTLTYGSVKSFKIILAGVGGFEPPISGSKPEALTTWRHPNITS